jgi:hypothetical protein
MILDLPGTRQAGWLRDAARRAGLSRASLRRLWLRMGWRFPAPAPWVEPGHYYSPMPSLVDIEAHERVVALPPPDSLPGIDLRLDAQLRLLSELRRFYVDQPFPMGHLEGLRYHFENEVFGYSDAILLHCLLRHLRPRRIVEVGSGFSSAAILDTVELFLDWSTKVTFVEPYPERLLTLLKSGDLDRAALVREPVQSVDLGLFRELEAGDVLLIDSTHVAKLGSDVNHHVFQVLPQLGPGVYVHFHDILYPFEYPLQWAKEGRAWNEAYLLRAFLSFNPTYEIVLFNDLLGRRFRDVLERDFPLCLRNTGGSIWLRRTAVGQEVPR